MLNKTTLGGIFLIICSLYIGMRLQVYWNASEWFVWVASVTIVSQAAYAIKQWFAKLPPAPPSVVNPPK